MAAIMTDLGSVSGQMAVLIVARLALPRGKGEFVLFDSFRSPDCRISIICFCLRDWF